MIDEVQTSTAHPAAIRIYDLALKLHACAGDLDVSAEDVALMKKRVAAGIRFPFVAGQALRMLEA